MWIFVFFIGMLTTILCLVGAEPALPLKKCKKYDSPCILEAVNPLVPIFAAGIPEYNVEATDPLYVDAFNNSGSNLNLVVKNVSMTGVKDCVFTKMEMTETRMIGTMLCDIASNGQYKMSGKLLLFPVSGSGNVHVVMNKVSFTGDADIAEVTGKDGKKHWKIKGFRHSYDIQGKATLDFGNLFGENEVLKNATRQLLDNSPKDVILDIGAPAVEAVARAMYKNINNFFKIKPIEDLVLP